MLGITGRQWRWLAAGMMGWAVLATGNAAAQAGMVSSNPADGSRLTTSPARVSVTLSEEIRAGDSTLRVSRQDGSPADLGDARVDKANRHLISVGVGALPPAVYTVHWHAVAATTNAMTDGTFSFTITAESEPGAAALTGPPGGASVPAGGTSGGGSTAGVVRPTLPASGHPVWPAGLALLAVAVAALGWTIARAAR